MFLSSTYYKYFLFQHNLFIFKFRGVYVLVMIRLIKFETITSY